MLDRKQKIYIMITNQNSVHTRFSVFAGPEDGSCGFCGNLCMRNEEFNELWEQLRRTKIEIQRPCRKCGQNTFYQPDIDIESPLCISCMSQKGGGNDPEAAKEE